MSPFFSTKSSPSTAAPLGSPSAADSLSPSHPASSGGTGQSSSSPYGHRAVYGFKHHSAPSSLRTILGFSVKLSTLLCATWILWKVVEEPADCSLVPELRSSYLCGYSDVEILEIVSQPHGFTRGSPRYYHDGVWLNFLSLSFRLTSLWRNWRVEKMKDPSFSSLLPPCVLVSVEGEPPCQHRSCLFPLFLRPKSSDLPSLRIFLEYEHSPLVSLQKEANRDAEIRREGRGEGESRGEWEEGALRNSREKDRSLLKNGVRGGDDGEGERDAGERVGGGESEERGKRGEWKVRRRALLDAEDSSSSTLSSLDRSLSLSYNTIVDGGANIGIATVAFSLMFPHSRILAVEPYSANFKVLRLNTFHLRNVIPVRGALWSESGEFVCVHEDVRKQGYWSVMTSANVSEEASKDVHVLEHAPSLSLPFLLSLFSLPSVDLLKLDIEGAEREIFSPIPQRIASTPLRPDEEGKCSTLLPPPPSFSSPLSWINETKLSMVVLHEKLRPGAEEAVRTAFSLINFQLEFGSYHHIYRNKRFIQQQKEKRKASAGKV